LNLPALVAYKKRRGDFHAKAQRLYVNRAAGGNCHYCVVDGYIDAGTTAGEETGQNRNVPDQSQTMGHYLGDVHRRKRW
jgi:hypothetical protein